MINQHNLFGLIQQTYLGRSNISNKEIDKIQISSGRYQHHLLSNLCKLIPNARVLAVGDFRETHLATCLKDNIVDMTCVLRSIHPSHKVIFHKAVELCNNGSTLNYMNDIDDIKENQFDILYLGYYGSNKILEQLKPRLKQKCFIIFDHWQEKQAEYSLDWDRIQWCQEFYAYNPLEMYIDKKLVPSNKSTWWNGLFIMYLI